MSNPVLIDLGYYIDDEERFVPFLQMTIQDKEIRLVGDGSFGSEEAVRDFTHLLTEAMVNGKHRSINDPNAPQ